MTTSICKNQHDEIKHLLYSGLFADFTIQCGEEKIPVHKAIICTASKFFMAACTVDMQEKKDGLIKLEDDIAVVRSMLEFCYSGVYDVSNSGVNDALGQPLNYFHHAKVYVIGEKYDIPELMSLAESHFRAAAGAIAWFLDEHTLRLVRYVFANTASSSSILRRSLVRIMSKRDFQIKDKKVLHDLVNEVPDFAAMYMELSMNGVTAKKVRKYVHTTMPAICKKCDTRTRIEVKGGWDGIFCPGCGSSSGLDAESEDELEFPLDDELEFPLDED